jgi:hypothetical protein
LNLANKHFELVDNPDGLASPKTIMVFTKHTEPFLGTYTGPNTIQGQVLVHTSPNGQTEMLYQSLTSDGELVAGRAKVILIDEAGKPTTMQLNWQWLTGSLSSGVSIWREIIAPEILLD